MSPQEIAIGALLLVGALLMLVAGLGIVRFPDVLTRMSAVSKASTLGAILLLAGSWVAHADLGVRTIAAALFLVLTTPVGAHRIARASYRNGDPLWKGTQLDELAQRRAEAGERGG